MLRFKRLRRLCFATAVVASGGLAAATPVAAQGLGLLNNLFGGGLRPAPGAPAYPGFGGAPGYAPGDAGGGYYNRPVRRLPRHRVIEPAVREAAPKDKPPPKNASVFVYVLGDSLGQALANGLDEALADRADVAVVHKARAATGLIGSNGFDWPKAVQELLASRDETGAKGKADDPKDAAAKDAKAGKVKIDVAVMMVGSNDRQPLEVGGRTVQPGTPDWDQAYAKRVVAINEAFRAKSIPLVWVGVPIAKDDGFADSMAALNDIYRDAAAKAGSIYVDTWEAFSDEDGDFSAYGPDINGQTVRLRSSDGVNFTRAGARKLAHFVEAHVRRALEGKTPAPELPTADVPPTPAPGAKPVAKPVAAARPDVGPIRNLNELPSATNGTLASFDPKRVGADVGPPVEAAGAAAPAGRADNARWSGKSPDEP